MLHIGITCKSVSSILSRYIILFTLNFFYIIGSKPRTYMVGPFMSLSYLSVEGIVLLVGSLWLLFITSTSSMCKILYLIINALQFTPNKIIVNSLTQDYDIFHHDYSMIFMYFYPR